MEQTQKISAERLAEKLHHAEVALGAFQSNALPSGCELDFVDGLWTLKIHLLSSIEVLHIAEILREERQ